MKAALAEAIVYRNIYMTLDTVQLMTMLTTYAS